MRLGGGGMHLGGGGMHLGGVRSFSAPRLGGMHVAGPRSGGFHSRFAGGGRIHFAHGIHGRTRFATANHVNRVAKNRAAARRFARNARANRLAHNLRTNRRYFTALHNNANRFANRTQFANTGQQRFGNHAFRAGNAFANANWGGHEWRHRGFQRFWAGGVFWPYFLGDYFSYAFWPYDYYGVFWGWGPDVLLWSAFWPYYDYPYWDYNDYGAGYPAPSYAGDIYSRYRQASVAQPQRFATISPQEAATTCAGFAPGVDNLPFQRIAAIVEPTPDQRQAIDELKAAMAKADGILSSACPMQTPVTPAARLDAMQQRLQAMLRAEEIVRPAIERLYGMLSSAQKQRLDAAIASGQRPAQSKVDLAKLCSGQAGFTDVPAEDIARTIRLNFQQRQDLDALIRVSDKAADMLRDSCPANVPNTLDARLDAAQARIRALIQAIDAIRPEVQTFFASLSPSQRTALNA